MTGLGRTLLESIKRILFRGRTSFRETNPNPFGLSERGSLWSIFFAPEWRSQNRENHRNCGLPITETAGCCLSSEFCWCLQVFSTNIQVPRHRATLTGYQNFVAIECSATPFFSSKHHQCFLTLRFGVVAASYLKRRQNRLTGRNCHGYMLRWPTLCFKP